MKKPMCILFLYLYSGIMFAQSGKQSIYLELKFEITPHSKPLPDSITIQYMSYPGKLWDAWIRSTRHNSNTKWVIPADKPTLLNVPRGTFLSKYNRWLLEPGDSVIVLVREGELHFSGRGADKLNMNNEIYALKEAMPKPFNPSFYTVRSVEDFLEWDNYLNRRMALAETVMESYKGLVSSLALYHAKLETIMEIEEQRWEKFSRLTKRKYFNLNRKELTELFDDHFFTRQAKWIWEQPISSVSQLPLDGPYFRKYNFADKKEITNSQVEGKLLLWEFAKKELRGEALEYFLAFYLTYYIIGKEGFLPQVDSTLKKYYADKDRDPEYQAYVKDYERKARILKQYRTIPPFTVYENKSRSKTKDDLDGKVVIMNFMKLGNKASELTTRYLKKTEESFKNNPYVKFLHLPVNLQPDSVIRKFNLTGYPAVFVMDLTGRLITSSFIDSTLDARKINKIVGERADVAKKEDWQGNMDGPYVLRDENDAKVYQVLAGKLTTDNLKSKAFNVAADEPGRTFNVTLKNHYDIEPSTFLQPEKLLAFSDIEGEFEPLRLLLQQNKVIDQQYNWTFGKGHVVFAGDMFDRGEQVTECLWLMYLLEEKAKAAGGYVHFILGNHEIMSLSGDHRYTRSKYAENSQKIGKLLIELYGKGSELGKWLRSKNIVEKIGDMLFIHAGISKEVNDLGLTVGQINELARPWYDNCEAAKQSADTRLHLLYDSELSPFWYRDYYVEREVKTAAGGNKLYVSYKTPANVIDAVLKQYGVNKIVTGHTHFSGVKNGDKGKYLTVHYDGKVINTDTFHRLGYSEALMVEGGKYYAVNKNGEKRELFNGSAQNTQVASK